jgi:hypothetical protein
MENMAEERNGSGKKQMGKRTEEDTAVEKRLAEKRQMEWGLNILEKVAIGKSETFGLIARMLMILTCKSYTGYSWQNYAVIW